MVTVRIDEPLKKKADSGLANLNMTATDAVTQLYRFIAEHGRMPVTERIVTFDNSSLRGRAIALNPADAVKEMTRQFLLALKSEEVLCCDPAAFDQAVVEYFIIYTADEAACLLAGVSNVTFMDNAGNLRNDDLKHDRLLTTLRRDFKFSDDQSLTFMNSIVAREHVDQALVRRNGKTSSLK
nr:type II toxin-antitoxin system RelB/DinJ family antitoxin [Erwinia mallotivora]